MRIALFLCVILVMVTIVFSRKKRPIEEPEIPGPCFHKYIGYMEPDQKKELIGRCSMIHCKENGLVLETSCGYKMVDNKIVQPDYSKPYPECCQPVDKDSET